MHFFYKMAVLGPKHAGTHVRHTDQAHRSGKTFSRENPAELSGNYMN
jgi:hypothetical protein